MQPSADLSLAQRIDSVCDRFEADWKAGRRQPLKAYLADVNPGEQEAMRSALQAIQEELEKQVGASTETPASQNSVRTGAYQPSSVDLVGSCIGRFKILSLLGEGAFGKVYKARDPQLEREVAVKVPKLEAFGGPFDLSRFLREAKAAAAIQHPNICPVHEVVAEGEQPYIVMAFIPGKSLADYLKDRPNLLPQKQVALIVRKLALALQAAHEKGIVHRDLKPANILFDPKRKDVVITDFGLASRAAGDARQTQSGVLVGTPAYMSPEQARGEAKHVGPASDIFSLGVILYEMLTGKRAFHGSLGDVIGQVQHVDPVPPRSVNAEIDPRLDAICRKALAKTPEQRFASMKSMAAALDKYLKDQPATAAPTAAQPPAEAEQSVGLAQVVAALSADRKADTEAAVEAAVRKTRIPVWKLLAPAGLLGILLVLGIIFFARTPTATVLINIDVDLNDKTLAFFLDSKAIPADELKSPIELKVGTHELLVKRGDEVIRRFTFTVSRDAGPRIELKEETPVTPTPQSAPKKEVESEPLPGPLVFDHPLSKTDTLEKLYSFHGISGGSGFVVPGRGLRLVPGNGTGMVWPKPFLGDRYRVQFEVQLMNKDARAGWVLNGPGCGTSLGSGYGTLLDLKTFRLQREGVEAQTTALVKPLALDEWATVQADVNGGNITVAINGLPVAKFSDAEPLTGPLHGWLGLTGVEAIFRNLKIWSSAKDTTRERQLTPPVTAKPLANGKLLYELKLAGGELGSEWWKYQPGHIDIVNGTLLLGDKGNGNPAVILDKPLGPDLACEIEFEFTTPAAHGLMVMLWSAKKAPQAAKDCEGGWLAELPHGHGESRILWQQLPKDAGSELNAGGTLVASTPYYATISGRKYLVRMEANRDSLRVFRDGGLVLAGKKPENAASPTSPVFLGIRQAGGGGFKVHAVRVYQTAPEGQAKP